MTRKPTLNEEASALDRSDEHSRDLDHRLAVVFGASHGKKSMLHSFDQRPGRRWVGFFVGLVFFSVCFLAFFFYGLPWIRAWRQTPVAGLALRLEGASAIAVGGEETYRIFWSNQSNESLSSASIRLTFPSDFFPFSVRPALSEKNLFRWNFTDIAPGKSGVIEVQGVFSGALGTESALQALGTYKTLSSASERENVVMHSVVYRDTVLDGQLVVPTKIMAGDLVSIRYRLLHRGKQPMKGLAVRFVLPTGFLPQSSFSVVRVDGVDTVMVPLGELSPGASSTAILTGTFAAGLATDALFRVEAGRRALGDIFYPAQRTQGRVTVLAGDFSVHAVVNGSATDQSLQPGEPLRLAIAYQNTSSEVLKDVSLRVGFESFVDGRSVTGTSLIDWVHVESSASFVSSTRSRIQFMRFEKKQISEFETLLPDTEGTIDCTVPTLALPQAAKDGFIRFFVEGVVGTVGSTKVDRVIRTESLTVRYRSDADLFVQARYFTEEGAPLGFGPLPPVAHKTTAYRIFWRLTKSLHSLEGVVMTAHLPSVAAWSARTNVEQGVLSYDPATRIVRWVLDTVPEGSPELEASFEIQITPETNDIGRFASLLDETVFVAQDAVLKEAIRRTKPALSTDLQEDEGARGKGVVRKE